MDRQDIIQTIKEIKKGRTFERSRLPKTIKNKTLWEELRLEIKEGYSIDIPKEHRKDQRCRA